MPVETPRSTLKFSAQTRCFSMRMETGEGSKPQGPKDSRLYSVIPKHETPVRGKRAVYNPFNERLVESLNGPTCSPDFCSTMVSSAEAEEGQGGSFFWTVEDVWRLNPAPIESPQTDVEENLDEETESQAQEAIERYFQESHHILSPIVSPHSVSLPTDHVSPAERTPVPHSDRAMSTPCGRQARRVTRCVASTQTLLSFSEDIPESVLQLLKPFTNLLDESQMDLSSSNVSFSNLRRKLFCNEGASSDEEGNKITGRFLPADWTPDRVQSTIEMFSRSPDISPIPDGILSNPGKASEVALNHSAVGDSAGETHHMSVDIGFDGTMDSSMIQHALSQSSADTGYQTHSSDPSKNADQIDVRTKQSEKSCGNPLNAGLDVSCDQKSRECFFADEKNFTKSVADVEAEDDDEVFFETEVSCRLEERSGDTKRRGYFERFKAELKKTFSSVKTGNFSDVDQFQVGSAPSVLQHSKKDVHSDLKTESRNAGLHQSTSSGYIGVKAVRSVYFDHIVDISGVSSSGENHRSHSCSDGSHDTGLTSTPAIKIPNKS